MKTIPILTLTLSLALLLSCSDAVPSQPQTTPPAEATTLPSVPDPTTQSADSVDMSQGVTGDQLVMNGVITLPPQNYATVSIPIDGTVRSVDLLVGQYIAKGASVVVLENPRFIELQQEYIEASAQCEYLEDEYERQKNMAQADATSGKRVAQSKADYLSMCSRRDAAAAQLQLLDVNAQEIIKKGIIPFLEVKAPISGYLSNLQVNQGKHITAGQPICEIVNKESIILKLTAYERDLHKLQVGETIEFRVNGLTGNIFEATILTIGQHVDLVNRSVEVYAKSKQNHNQFRPGMYVIAKIKE